MSEERSPWNPDPTCPVCRSVQWVVEKRVGCHTHLCERGGCLTVFTPGNTPQDWATKAADAYRSGLGVAGRQAPPVKRTEAKCLSCGEAHAVCPEPTGPKPPRTPVRDQYRRRSRELRHIRAARALIGDRGTS